MDVRYLTRATARFGNIRSGTASLGLVRQLHPGLDAAVRYNLRNTFRTASLVRPSGADDSQDTIQLGTAVGSVLVSLDFQRLDNPLAPRRGHKTFLSLEYARPQLSFNRGQASFVKFQGRFLAVLPISKGLTVRNSFRYEQGFPIGASHLPKVERYFAGGDTTIRGFDLDRARSETITEATLGGLLLNTYRPFWEGACVFYTTSILCFGSLVLGKVLSSLIPAWWPTVSMDYPRRTSVTASAFLPFRFVFPLGISVFLGRGLWIQRLATTDTAASTSTSA